METENYETLKQSMLEFAFDINNLGLETAVKLSRNTEDLKSCIKQAYGVGAERFKRAFSFVL